RRRPAPRAPVAGKSRTLRAWFAAASRKARPGRPPDTRPVRRAPRGLSSRTGSDRRSSGSRGAQPAESGKVDRIHVVGLRRFQDDGNGGRAGIGKEAPEPCEADLALTDVMVAVHTAAELAPGIVGVDQLQVREADDRVEEAQRLGSGLRRAKVVAGG